MRICVFGAGSLGSALGGILAQNHEVALVGRKKHMDAVRAKGLRLVGDIETSVRVDAFETVTDLCAPDLLIISTKAYDTASAINACREVVNDKTMALTLQNGLGNLEKLREWLDGRAFGGTTTLGAALVSPGVVRVSGRGWTVVGSDVNARGAREIVNAFKSCGLRVQMKHDVMREIWGKAVVNACINPTAAILRVRNGRLLENEDVAHLMRDVSRECELVAAASGVALPMSNMYARVRAVCRDTANNVSSMLQDVQKGRRTEIHQINGAFCSLGKPKGIRTPLNETLVSMVDSIDHYG